MRMCETLNFAVLNDLFLVEENDANNFTVNNEEEKEDEEGENEAKWRAERLERERFLKELEVLSFFKNLLKILSW